MYLTMLSLFDKKVYLVFNVLRYHLSNILSKHKLLHTKICVEIFVKHIELESIS
jgi:hypothetical protein